MEKLTAKKLAKFLYEELDRDDWGDIDPLWIQAVSEGIDPDDSDYEEEKALSEVLERVVLRIREE